MTNQVQHLCASNWPWVDPARRKWAGHVCGRRLGHPGRHICLADRCRSWHRNEAA